MCIGLDETQMQVPGEAKYRTLIPNPTAGTINANMKMVTVQ
jgi:hypothetical protein